MRRLSAFSAFMDRRTTGSDAKWMVNAGLLKHIRNSSWRLARHLIDSGHPFGALRLTLTARRPTLSRLRHISQVCVCTYGIFDSECQEISGKPDRASEEVSRRIGHPANGGGPTDSA